MTELKYINLDEDDLKKKMDNINLLQDDINHYSLLTQ
jgi:hypothetical protein